MIRDLYSREMDEILVDGERGYREAKDYMKMLMPSHAKNVKHYADALPLFSRFQVESYLSAMFNPVVQLKSGGYIVIDVTEALVAIDVNSGRATREASIEDTALKTNMEAAEEAARQMRLRDLAGLIVIDFIDMEDRRNNAAVEKKLKDKLKTDRARIQVGRISPFGLLEMSRQRLRPGMIEATTKACPHCHGTGRVRSDDSMALALLREIEEEGVAPALEGGADRRPGRDRQLPPEPEARAHRDDRGPLRPLGAGRGRPGLISPDYRVERFKTASRVIPTPESLNLPAVAYPGARTRRRRTPTRKPCEEAAAEATGEPLGGKRKRRRRRRGGRAGQDRPAPRPPRPTRRRRGRPEPSRSRGAEAAAEAPAAEEPEARPKSRRRSRGARPAEEPPTPRPSRRPPWPRPVRRGDRPRRGAGAGDRRGARDRRAAAPPARAGAQAGGRGARRGRRPRASRKPFAGPAGGAAARARRPSRRPSLPPKRRTRAPSRKRTPADEARSEGPKRRGWWSRAARRLLTGYGSRAGAPARGAAGASPPSA